MKSLKQRRLTDNAAHWVITLGGAATIFVILALFVFIFLEVYPLLKGAKVLKENTYLLRDNAVSAGVDEYQEVAYVMYKDGDIEFISLSNGEVLKRYTIAGIKDSSITHQDATNLPPHSPPSQGGGKGGGKNFSHKTNIQSSYITSVSKDNNRFVLGTDDGKIITVSITFSESFDDGKRTVLPVITEEETVRIDDEKRAFKCITSKKDNGTTVTAVSTEDSGLILKSTEIKETLLGEAESKEIKKDITNLIAQESGVEITSLALDLFMENLYIGAASGELFHINVRDRENPFLVEKTKVSAKAVTALGFLLGDVSLVAGDQGGGVNVWMQVRDEVSPSGWTLKNVHTLKSHIAPVVSIAPSTRDKGFVTAASDGTIHLNHATSEQTLLYLQTKSTPTAIAFSHKANGILAVDSHNNLFQWNISNPHPETTLKTLFGAVWYEGYEKPEFVWQSTGGTDDFEPKLSLVPLIFGTIKGTIYALIIAIPIGILSALYTSQFLHNSLKKVIKPSIEFMAALPSVILGFLAGLWLAPLIERILPALVIMPFFMLLSITIAFCVWKCISSKIKNKFRYGT